jgi:hypothetical protein
MNAQSKVETPSNLSVWNALSKSDPAHTKGFKRGGGFTGTALKPIWTVLRLTEQFGPCGIGWGIGEPKFDLVHSQDGEVLVYCTVSAWHHSPANMLWGVGGDKAVTKNKNGPVHDDEAFKKAFTDAVGNAFKFIGVAADIHMGLFDDSKYVDAMREEFAPRPDAVPEITDAQCALIQTLAPAVGKTVPGILKAYKVESLTDLTEAQAAAAIARLKSLAPVTEDA